MDLPEKATRICADEVLRVLSALLYTAMLQPAPTASGGGGAVATAADPMSGCGQTGQLFFLFAAMAFMFFFMIRPQMKQQKEHDGLLKGLKRGDIVRTNGGIRGEIAEMTDTDVNLIIADRVKINVLKADIRGLDAPAKIAPTVDKS